MGSAAKVIAIVLAVFLFLTAALMELVTGSFAEGSPEALFQSRYRSLLSARSGASYGYQIAQVALAEWEAHGGISGAGWTYCSYWDKPIEDWCCDFVYYCADLCRYVEGTENAGPDPLFGQYTAVCDELWRSLIAHGAETFSAWDNITPQPGDIVFYHNEGEVAATTLSINANPCHVGIVVEADGSSITTVEGNTGGRSAQYSYLKKIYIADIRGAAWDGAAVYGFAWPQYPYSVDMIGDLSQPFYFETSAPDLAYSGHAVPGLTASQIASIKNTIFGEYGYNLGGAIAVAQSIRDNVDRSAAITYDNFVTACQYDGGMVQRAEDIYDTLVVNTAFDYVFIKGCSAIRHPIYCFYSKTPELQTDADYQALFLKQLRFVLEVGDMRYFSWEENS